MASFRSENNPGGVNEARAMSRQPDSGLVQWAKSVYIPKERPETERPSMVLPADDGYMRKTPVQEIRVPKGYKSRIVKRVVATIIGLAFAAAVIYVLFSFVVNY